MTTRAGRQFERDRGARLASAGREAVALLAVAAVATAASWALRSDGLPLRADATYYERELAAPLIDPAQARALYDAGDHLFVDVRPDSPPTTVPGAFLIREATFDDDLDRNFDFLGPSDPLVVFGDGSLNAASNVAGRLLDRGWTDVVIMSGGLAAWQQAGGPVGDRPEVP